MSAYGSCPFMRGVRLWEVVDTEFSEMAGTSDWCPLTVGVRLREVSASGGLTVLHHTV